MTNQLRKVPVDEGKRDVLKKKMEMLEAMKTSHRDVAKGKYQTTLAETERKQNVGRGLTHVTDKTYEFFAAVEQERTKRYTVQSARSLKKKVLQESSSHLKSVVKSNAFYGKYVSVGSAEFWQFELLDDLVGAYLAVANNEFRKHLCRTFGKKRKLNHRTEVLKRSSTKLPEKPKAGTSKQKHTRVGRKRKIAISVVPVYVCPVCDVEYTEEADEEEEWIACEKCEKWLHRECAGLSDQKAWSYCSAPDK